MPEAGETTSQTLSSQQEVNLTSGVQTASPQGIAAGVGGGSWAACTRCPAEGAASFLLFPAMLTL